ncbi:MAG: acetolactate synthase small subunit [Armatimonadota bacterium]|jgi:acetolactate synthase-1/3 small subunit|nr:MAG: acetolactate synthase small subunit [Armatimonadota bacterium]
MPVTKSSPQQNVGMQHTITVLVENKPGVLTRVAGLFARRGYNIESLAVSITEDPTVSRMTVVASGDAQALDQINKQLAKLIDVIHVADYTDMPMVERELALIKVNADTSVRGEVMQLVDIFRAKIIDISDKTFTIEVTGGVEKINAFEKMLEPYGIREMVRTGRIALVRGARTAAQT